MIRRGTPWCWLLSVEVRLKNVLLRLRDEWSVMDRRRQVYRETQQLKDAGDCPSGVCCVGTRVHSQTTHTHTQATFSLYIEMCVLSSIHSNRVVVAWRERHLSVTIVMGGHLKKKLSLTHARTQTNLRNVCVSTFLMSCCVRFR